MDDITAYVVRCGILVGVYALATYVGWLFSGA